MDRLQIGGRSFVFNSVFVLLNLTSFFGVYYSCAYSFDQNVNSSSAIISWNTILLISSIFSILVLTYLILVFRGGLLFAKNLRMLAGFWLLFRSFSFLNDIHGFELELDIRLMDGDLILWLQSYVGEWFSFSKLSPLIAAWCITIVQLILGIFLLIGYKMRFTSIVLLLYALVLLFFRIQEFEQPRMSFFLPVRKEALDSIMNAWFSLWVAMLIFLVSMWNLMKSKSITQNSAQENVVILVLGFILFGVLSIYFSWYSLLIFFPITFLGALWIMRITNNDSLNMLGASLYLGTAGVLIILYGNGFGTIKDFGRYNSGDTLNFDLKKENKLKADLLVYLPLRDASKFEYRDKIISESIKGQSQIKILQHKIDSSVKVINALEYKTSLYPDSLYTITYSGLDSSGVAFPGEKLKNLDKLVFLFLNDRKIDAQAMKRWYELATALKKMGANFYIIHPVSFLNWNVQVVGEERANYKLPTLFADKRTCSEISRYDESFLIISRGKIIKKYEGYFKPSNQKIVNELKALWQKK